MKWKAAALLAPFGLLPVAQGCALDPMPVDGAGRGGGAGAAGSEAGGRAGSSASAGAGGRAGANTASGSGGGAGEGGESGDGGGGESGAAGDGGAAGAIHDGGGAGSAGDGGAAGDGEPAAITHGGYYLTWTLRRQSDNTPITCEEADGHTVSVLTTLSSDPSNFAEDLFDCSAGSGMVVRDFAEYAVVATLVNDTNQTIGAAPTESTTLVPAPCDRIVGTTCVQDAEAVITVNGF